MTPDQPDPQPQRPLPPNYARETTRIRQVASNPDCWFRWMPHAEQRMQERGYVADDVITALTNGHVVRVDVREDVVFRVVGKNIDDETIEVAAAVLNGTTIKIVTVI
jgi:hypothetical protein